MTSRHTVESHSVRHATSGSILTIAPTSAPPAKRSCRCATSSGSLPTISPCRHVFRTWHASQDRIFHLPLVLIIYLHRLTGDGYIRLPRTPNRHLPTYAHDRNTRHKLPF